MLSTWILVANASQAFFYALDVKELHKGKIALELLNTLEHEESRKKDAELMSDRSGHFQSGNLGHGSSYYNAVDPKEHEAEVFAKEVAQALESSRISKDYEQLILVIPPHFHGLLNKHLNKNVVGLIKEKIEKDYTKDHIKKLEAHLARHLISS